MNIVELVNNKSLKAMEKRIQIIEILLEDNLSLQELITICDSLKDKQIAIILEAIEEITNKKMKQLDPAYIDFVEKYILSDNNSCKREASRIVGNLAEQYPNKLDSVIQCLIKNTTDDSTVVRWGSAYALSRIIVLTEYANTDLYDQISDICEKEQNNGVKNQYVKALKKAVKIRK
ncbi:HEAT repeat domain-containing protein [Sporosarcina gallistercoris]|uniref:HEAT repeat domain-containing protein n=1 Tax=Sporosarcina gallistercoris TaxID=2762245 RepID=UPI003D26C252